MSVILEHVNKDFDGKHVISDFSYSFPDTGRFCIFGPSGCGKTTLLRLISGLEKPDSGNIRFDRTVRFGWQFQEDRLLPWFTVRQNLNQIMNNSDITDYLNLIGLGGESRKFPNELSGGMKRRVSLLRALKCESDIVLLDEPVREVDETNAEAMLDLIRKETDGKLLIMVSHDRTQAEKLGCKVIELRKADKKDE